MSEVRDCPVCGARCRVARDPDSGQERLLALQHRQLVRKIEQLKAALQRVRAAVKADAKACQAKPPR